MKYSKTWTLKISPLTFELIAIFNMFTVKYSISDFEALKFNLHEKTTKPKYMEF